STQLRRIITARDRTCRFPGCSRPARHCDIDHDQEWTDHGITATCNLRSLCRMHHQMKTKKHWTSHTQPDQTTIWTSPLGYTTRQPPASYPTPTDPPTETAA
ncbi:MAG TPA: HNH endonuclease signature motif containing protein, partial [Mycobacteriales bacterium]|nr:HNH endonuclease signature motif containing protein [Mycobacteriales bacterium]